MSFVFWCFFCESFCGTINELRVCFIWYACIMPCPRLYVSVHRLASLFLCLCVRGASKSWLIPLYVSTRASTYHYMCPHSTRYVSSSHCICVLQSWRGDARRMCVCVCVVCVCVCVSLCIHTYIVLYLFLSHSFSRTLSLFLSLSLSLELAGSRASLEKATHCAERADSNVNVAMHSWEHARKHPRLPNPLTHLCRYLSAVVA
jgi:hypothetical protein